MIIPMSVIRFFWGIVGLLAATSVYASELCRTPIEEVVYSASFIGEQKSKMELTIGTNGKAAIRSKGRCLALCRVYSSSAGAVSMMCRNPLLGHLEAEVAILRAGDSRAVLRFGTWLRGYKDSVLKVHYDGTFKRRLKRFAPAVVVVR